MKQVLKLALQPHADSLQVSTVTFHTHYLSSFCCILWCH